MHKSSAGDNRVRVDCPNLNTRPLEGTVSICENGAKRQTTSEQSDSSEFSIRKEDGSFPCLCQKRLFEKN